MEIYLIRHSEPILDKGICYGFSDIDINPLKDNDLEEISSKLPMDVDKVFSSPSIRCRKLAEALFKDSITFDDRLKEMNFGDWELKPWNEIQQDHLNTWMQDFVNVKVPNGESFLELVNRISHFFNEIQSKKYKKVVVFTHAGVIRSALHIFEKTPLPKTFEVKINFTSVWKF